VHINLDLVNKKLEDHTNRFTVHTDLITDLQNEMRKQNDNMKMKANGDEIDSVHALINELYDKVVEMEKNPGVPGSASDLSVQRAATQRTSISGSLGMRGNQLVKELTD
jgi:hypothetical protein